MAFQISYEKQTGVVRGGKKGKRCHASCLTLQLPCNRGLKHYYYLTWGTGSVFKSSVEALEL